MKGKTYKSYVRSATGMLYGSEMWCSRKNEVAISIKSTKIYGKVMCQVKLVDKRNTEKLMLGLKKAADKLARANDVRWYDHVLKIFDKGNTT